MANINRPVFKDRITALLDGETIRYRSEEAALREIYGWWEPEPREITVYPSQPGTARFQKEQSVDFLETGRTPELWCFGLANAFRNSVSKIDRNLQGRILEAITFIAKSPLTPHGDTVKPLSGQYSGYWRYRISNFRLLYYPDASTKTVTLCDFTSRADAYE